MTRFLGHALMVLGLILGLTASTFNGQSVLALSFVAIGFRLLASTYAKDGNK